MNLSWDVFSFQWKYYSIEEFKFCECCKSFGLLSFTTHPTLPAPFQLKLSSYLFPCFSEQLILVNKGRPYTTEVVFPPKEIAILWPFRILQTMLGYPQKFTQFCMVGEMLHGWWLTDDSICSHSIGSQLLIPACRLSRSFETWWGVCSLCTSDDDRSTRGWKEQFSQGTDEPETTSTCWEYYSCRH